MAVTALALWALVEQGNDHHIAATPAIRDAVAGAKAWLLAHQTSDGAFSPTEFDSDALLDNHAPACRALIALYRLSKDDTLRRPIERAISWLRASRSDSPGGWGTQPDALTPDSESTAWALEALSAARTAGIGNIADDDLLHGLRLLDHVSVLDRRHPEFGRAGFRERTDVGRVPNSDRLRAAPPRFELLDAMTAFALTGRLYVGEPTNGELMLAARKRLLATTPRWRYSPDTSSVDFAGWFWAAQALTLCDRAWPPTTSTGRWFARLSRILIGSSSRGHQRTDQTCARGSWDPIGPWVVLGGRVHATALAVLTLQTWQRGAAMRERLGAPNATANAALVRIEAEKKRRHNVVRARLLAWLKARKGYVCPTCGGRLYLKCKRCQGLGYERFGPEANQMQIRCRRCKGKGKLRCARCADNQLGLLTERVEAAKARFGLSGLPIRRYKKSSIALWSEFGAWNRVFAAVDVTIAGQTKTTRELSEWRWSDQTGAWRITSILESP